jgi:hypothetical protein
MDISRTIRLNPVIISLKRFMALLSLSLIFRDAGKWGWVRRERETKQRNRRKFSRLRRMI